MNPNSQKKVDIIHRNSKIYLNFFSRRFFYFLWQFVYYHEGHEVHEVLTKIH
jgi:hypothetical protein